MHRTSENMQVVQAFFTALEARDKEGMLKHFDDAGYWDAPAGGAFSGRMIGRAGLGRLAELFFAARPSGRMTTDLTLHAEADRVFAEFTWAPLADSAPRAPTRSLAVFELVFGKVAAVREFEAGPPALGRAE